jgi:hypothetical protein
MCESIKNFRISEFVWTDSNTPSAPRPLTPELPPLSQTKITALLFSFI